MLNFCLRDPFIELSHCNRHFAIKGKTSVTFPIFPFPRVIKFLESLSILTCISSREISRNEFVTATAISEELIDFVLFFICKWSNLSFSRSVWRHSWWNFSWFFWQKTVFLLLSISSFFLELAFHGRFSLFVLFQAVFVYFELVSDAFLPHQIFSNLTKNAANNKNLFKGGGGITVSVFPFS